MSHIKKKSTVQIVIDRLTQAIIDGELKPGDQISPEADLASSLGVGRNTVREALRTLIAYGVLEVRKPMGTFVCDTFSPQAMNPLVYGLILTKEDSYDELIRLREILDYGLAIILMEKGLTDEEAAFLFEVAKRVEDAFAKPEVDIEEVTQADVDFHLALAKVSGNQLFLPTYSMMTNLTIASRRTNIASMLAGGRQRFMIDTHYRMIDCLVAGDVAELYKAVQDSIIDWKTTGFTKS